MAKNKKYRKHIDRNTAMRYMSLLEQNDMNLSQTAREVRTSRQNMKAWKNRYWQEYLNEKPAIQDQVHDIQAVKFKTVKELDEIKDIFSGTLKLALQRAKEILDDPEKLQTMKHSDLIQLINVISPYAAEKLGVTGTNDDPQSMKSTHTAFVQNIIEQMKIEGYNKLKDNEIKQN